MISCTVNLFAKENILSVYEKSYTEKDLKVCLKNGLEKLNVNLKEEVPEENKNELEKIKYSDLEETDKL